MNDITILTSSYNRGELLCKLFDSLCTQKCKEFEWLIIDDGSNDDTEKKVFEMIEKADFTIVYHKKENGGKHTALNYAYEFIKTPLVFIVDSDDILTDDAISVIKQYYGKYREEKDVCGFSFLRSKPNGEHLSTSDLPKDEMKESYVECRINREIGGDMAEVWYTHCLKEYPFPEYQGEKFLGEDIVWVRMAEKYKMRFINRVIYISDYLESGLTKNRRIHNIQSPNGCVARAESFLDSNSKLKVKIKAILQYQIYGRFAMKSNYHLFKRSKHKGLYIVFFIPAYILYCKWEKDYR